MRFQPFMQCFCQLHVLDVLQNQLGLCTVYINWNKIWVFVYSSVNDSRRNASAHINVALRLLCFLMIYRQALFRSTNLGAIPARVRAVGVNSSRLAHVSLRFTSYQ